MGVSTFAFLPFRVQPETGKAHGFLSTRTVYVIPGHGGSLGSITALTNSLKTQGWNATMVDIGNGGASINTYANQVASMVAASNEGSVMLVGYSEGGLIARATAAHIPGKIARVVTVSTPNQGTDIAKLGASFAPDQCDQACIDMEPGSALLNSLPSAVGDATRWMSLYSATDPVVRPAESGELPGSTTLEMNAFCGGTFDHNTLVDSPNTAAIVNAFLDEGTPPPNCPKN